MRRLRWAATEVTALLGVLLGALLLWAALELPDRPRTLTREVYGALEQAGLDQPVTAVLLVFRGYDTLLEVGVLLLALVATLSVGGLRSLRPVPRVPVRHPLLRAGASHLAPLMVLVAGHLLVLGARGPGGAFQGGAVLGATFVLLWVAGQRTVFAAPGPVQRLLAASGFVAFFTAALVPALAPALLFGPGEGEGFFSWPRAQSPRVVLAVELVLALAIGATLAALFIAPQAEEREERPR